MARYVAIRHFKSRSAASLLGRGGSDLRRGATGGEGIRASGDSRSIVRTGEIPFGRVVLPRRWTTPVLRVPDNHRQTARSSAAPRTLAPAAGFRRARRRSVARRHALENLLAAFPRDT